MSSRLDDFPVLTGFQIGQARVTRPFLNLPTPDKYARLIERDWWVVPTGYSPATPNRTTYTNLLTYSEQFTAAAWTATNATLTAGALANPGDGMLTATSIKETVTNGEHRIAHAYTFTAVAHTLSVFARALSRSYLRLRANDGSTDFTGFFNLSAGTVGTLSAGVSASILALEDGWYRCRITFTPDAASGNVYVNTSTDGSTVSYAGDTAKGVYLYGAQIEAASTAGPYIVTTNASRAISAPDVDPGDTIYPADPFAFLVDESSPLQIDAVGRGRYVRTWARVPAAHEVPTSVQLTRPSISGAVPQAIGSYRIFQPDTTLLRYTAYQAQTVQSDTGAPSGFYPTGGTYTLTFDGATTVSLAYNASASAVQTALNALTPVSNRGGVTVTGSYNSAGGFTITFASYSAIAISSSLTGPNPIFPAVTSSLNGYSQIVGAPMWPSTSQITSDCSGIVLFMPSPTVSFSDGELYSIGRRHVTISAYTNQIIGGSFTLTISGQTTRPIPYNAKITEVAAAINSLGVGTFYVGSTVNYTGQQSYSFGDSIIRNDQKVIEFDVIWEWAYPTAGTYILTFAGSTTGALPYNATASDVATALNALTSVSDRGGCTVTGTLPTGFTVAFVNPAITAASSLTPTSSMITPASDSIGRVQTLTLSAANLPRDLYIPGHNITAGSSLYILAAGSYYGGITDYQVPSGDVIRLNITPAASYAAAGTITEAGALSKASYEPGVANVRAKRVTRYYLPGVTTDIATAGDIPLPYNQSDSAALLEAILQGSGQLNWQVGELEPWEGPILQQTTVVVAAADI